MANPFAEPQGAARRRNIIIGIASAVLVICMAAYFFASGGKGTVVIMDTVSSQVVVTLNDRGVEISQQSDGIHVPAYPGHYRLKVTKSGYQPFIQDIAVEKGMTIMVRPAFAYIPKQDDSATLKTIQYVSPSVLGDSVLYLGNGGSTIYQMDLSVQVPLAITTRPLSGVQDIQWSAQPDVALIMKADGAYLQEIPTYNFVSQTLRKIAGTEFENAAWDPTDSNRLAVAYYPKSGEQSLMFSDKTGAIGDRKADLEGIERPRLVWSPDSRYVAVIGRSTDASRNHLWVYGMGDGSFVQEVPDSNVVDASFSPDGETIVYETAGNVLHTVSTDGSGEARLSIAGHVSQAAWHDSSSFFLPSADNGSLLLVSTKGGTQSLAYSFTDVSSIQGMYYFSETKTILFYTKDTLYTISVGI